MRKIFQKWLLLFVIIAFAATLLISYVVQTRQSYLNAVNAIDLKISDAEEQLNENQRKLALVQEMTDEIVLAKTRAFAEIIRLDPTVLREHGRLMRLKELLAVDELHVSDGRGVLIASTQDSFLGYAMDSRTQSAQFMPAIGDPAFELIQKPTRRGIDGEYFQYAGVARTDQPGIVQVGYVPRRIELVRKLADIASLAYNFRIGENGGIVICDKTLRVVSGTRGLLGNASDSSMHLPVGRFLQKDGIVLDMNGIRYIAKGRRMENYSIIGFLPQEEMYVNRNAMLTFLVVSNLVLFGVVFILVSTLVQRVVIDGIHKINGSLGKITDGELNEKVTVVNNDEFRLLSNGINMTVDALRQHIAEAAARIDAELEFARVIQHSALPNIFPPFPGQTEFDIRAVMYTAKEVGGDFYDYYLVGENKVALLIADVSGKGIGAALFMMTAKTLIKNLLVSGLPVSEAMTRANRELCENNGAGMFVTVFAGILDASTGKFTYSNAGHNAPLLYHAAEKRYEFLTSKPNLVLAGSPKVRYREYELEFARGDRMLLYTDGVTEAQNKAQKLFSNERLLALANSPELLAASLDSTLEIVKTAVDDFADGADQADDITMLILEYRGPHGGPELTVPAAHENLPKVLAFIREKMTGLNCSDRVCKQLELAVEEIFVNIADYAYRPGAGPAAVRCEICRDPLRVEVRFVDGGAPFNPLENPNPDLKAPLEERDPSGLGVFMVRQTMDAVAYQYEDGCNILTLTKNI